MYDMRSKYPIISLSILNIKAVSRLSVTAISAWLTAHYKYTEVSTESIGSKQHNWSAKLTEGSYCLHNMIKKWDKISAFQEIQEVYDGVNELSEIIDIDSRILYS